MNEDIDEGQNEKEDAQSLVESWADSALTDE